MIAPPVADFVRLQGGIVLRTLAVTFGLLYGALRIIRSLLLHPSL